MSSKSSKKNANKEDILVTSTITKKKNNSKTIIICLSIVIVLLSLVIIFLLLNNKSDNGGKCRSVAPIEKELKYQFINYNGYRFKMPLDWSFISEENAYEIINEKETMYVTLTTIKDSYEEFITSDYQKEYLEKIQVENNMTINKSSSGESNGVSYYYMDGTYNSYNYYVVAIGDDDSVILISAQFIDKLTYTNNKQNIIDFAVSGIKNNK